MTVLNASFFFRGSKKENILFSTSNFWTAFLNIFLICDALRDLVPYVQFKKREKHPQRSVGY